MKISKILQQLALASRLYGGYREQINQMDADDDSFYDAYAKMRAEGKRIEKLQTELRDLGLLSEEHSFNPY